MRNEISGWILLTVFFADRAGNKVKVKASHNGRRDSFMKKLVSIFLVLVILSVVPGFAGGESWMCPNCGETNASNFCGNCGTPRPFKGWVCSKCGETNTGNFCGNCGTPRSEGNVPDAEALYQEGEAAYQAQNYGIAIKILTSAAEAGSEYAWFRLGWMYANGEGVEQSYEKAAEYYQLAVDQGVPAAMNNLGVLYELGQGVEQSLEMAIAYYQQAAETGLESAEGNVRRLTATTSTPAVTPAPTGTPKPTATPRRTHTHYDGYLFSSPALSGLSGSTSQYDSYLFSSPALSGLSEPTGYSFAGTSPLYAYEGFDDNSETESVGSRWCVSCLGSGDCSTCNGTGQTNFTGTGSRDCPSCGGSGACVSCGGDGYR